MPDASARLSDLIAREWAHRLADDPLFATSVGEHAGDDRLPSVAAADLERRAATDRAFLDEILALDADTLSLDERISAALLERQLRDRIASFELGAWQLPLTSESGFHIDFAQLPRSVPLLTAADHDRYLARLRAWPKMVEQQIANLRVGVARGMVQPRVVLEGFDETMSIHDVERAEDSVFWVPFARLPAGISETDRRRLAGGSKARDPRAGGARLSRAPPLLRRRVPAGGAIVDRRERSPRRRRLLRAARALVHDARSHPRPGARDRSCRGGAHRN